MKMQRIARLFRKTFFVDIRYRCRIRDVMIFSSNNRQVFSTQIKDANLSAKTLISQIVARRLCDVPRIICWSCHHRYLSTDHGKAIFFCPSCHVVQQPNLHLTYFDIMNCDRSFDLDTNLLTQHFRRLQSQLHPDKFSLKSKVEQEFSSQQSSLVNEAYQTLLQPLKRGLYMLGLQGFSIEEGQVGHDIEFLTEIMELNEVLENGPIESLNNLRLEIKDKMNSCIEEASNTFQQGNLNAAKDVLSKLKYYDNIDKQLREKLL